MLSIKSGKGRTHKSNRMEALFHKKGRARQTLRNDVILETPKKEDTVSHGIKKNEKVSIMAQCQLYLSK